MRPFDARVGLVALPSPFAITMVPYEFAYQVPANTSGELAMEVDQDGTIELIRARIYAGPGLALRLTPYVRSRGILYPLLRTTDSNGKSYIDGDDDSFEYPISFPVVRNQGDEIVIQYSNSDAVNAYDFRVTVVVDHAGGVYPRWVMAGGVAGRG